MDCLALALFLSGLVYLFAKTFQLSGDAGYDFKYVWLAGEAWLRGLNPYLAGYHELGKALVADGHVPYMWVYPPSWYLPAVLTAAPGLEQAALFWNLANIALLLASSALLIAACGPLATEARARHGISGLIKDCLGSPWNLFFLHFWALAVLQATALTLSVGQTSILIYFGVCLLVFGTVKGLRNVAVLGLTILLLKPQLAFVFVAAMAVDRTWWGLLARSAALSVLISLPAFVVAPTAAFDWLSNLPRYDIVTSADWPQSVTGLRHAVWSLSGFDLGSIAALLAAALLMVALQVLFFRAEPSVAAGVETGAARAQPIFLACAMTAAVAPLHTYDLPLIGAILLVLARARPLHLGVGLLGAALLWRAGDLAKATGLYGEGTEHFEGTRLATIGALLMLFAVFKTLRRQRVRATA